MELGVDYDQSLKASLEFEYDGVKVPYTRTPKTPYVTIKDPAKDLLYWVKGILHLSKKLIKCF